MRDDESPAPVSAAGEVIGSCTLTGPTERMSGKVDRCVQLVREAGASLSASLGTAAEDAR